MIIRLVVNKYQYQTMKVYHSIKTKIKRFIFNACQIDQIFSILRHIDHFDMQSFILSNTPKHTVLICEFFYAHGECLPGYIKYFLTLGYKVHVIIKVDNYILGTFAKCNFPEDKVKYFVINENIVDNELFYQKIICQSLNKNM